MNESRRKSRKPGRRPSSGGGKRHSEADALRPAETPPDVESFREWDLGDEIQDAIAEMGITKPTPIQALAIGPVLEGKDVIAKAETGTGKTLAFGAPMIARIDAARASVLALVLCPTRELSEQVYTVLVELGKTRDLKVALIVGGEPMQPQVKALQSGSQVVVGTPGRVLDLMGQGFLSFPWTEFVVLDEADKMLEIGFIDDVRKILAGCNEERQTLLFSATFPPQLLSLAREGTRDPIEIATAQGLATVDAISQFFLEVTEDNRPRALSIMIDRSEPEDVFLVFCDRRTDVDKLMRRMERERFSVRALHGGYDQAARFRVMTAFRTGDVKCLIATDVASRGLDVLHVTHVINYGVPRDISDYTHRIGRTGRAGRTGTSVTLVGPSNQRNWSALLSRSPFDIDELRTPHDLGAQTRLKHDSAEAEPKRNGRASGGRDGRGEEARPEREERSKRGGRGSGRRSERESRREPEASEASEERAARPRSGRKRPAPDERPVEQGSEREEREARPVHSSSRARPAAGSSFGTGVEDAAVKKPMRKLRRTTEEPEAPPTPAPEKWNSRKKGPGFGTGI